MVNSPTTELSDGSDRILRSYTANSQKEQPSIRPIVTQPSSSQCQNRPDNNLDTSAIPTVNNMLPSNSSASSVDFSATINTSQFDRIPDIIKGIKDFSGVQSEFLSWRNSVDRALCIFESIIGTPKYIIILNAIRNKILGKADTTLQVNNVALNWDEIRDCLANHYSDKRDLSTLEFQLNSLCQGNRSYQSFCEIVQSHLSVILNKVTTESDNVEVMSALARNYRRRALDVFIRGLNGDMKKFLPAKEPADLADALLLCHKIDNKAPISNTYRFPNGNRFLQGNNNPNRFNNNFQQYRVPQTGNFRNTSSKHSNARQANRQPFRQPPNRNSNAHFTSSRYFTNSSNTNNYRGGNQNFHISANELRNRNTSNVANTTVSLGEENFDYDNVSSGPVVDGTDVNFLREDTLHSHT